jgi:GTP-binding protein EngB required for normal cell division
MKKHEQLEEDIEKGIELKLNEERTHNDQVDDISNKLKEFYDLYEKEGGNKNNLNSLKIYINSSIGLLKTSKTLYIPLVGVSNAGKSTVLNSIIGTSLLPAHRNECTKKGILIKHWNKDFAIIRKTKFIKESMYTGKDIYSFKSEEKIIAQGNENIYKILEGINGKFTNKEEDFFYEINIKIKLIDKLKIDEKLKEKICFIDLPGFGTNNPFEEKDTYSHLISSCNIFLFVVFNLKILEKDNQKMLKQLYTKMAELRNIPCQAFINKCLFIINCDQIQKISDETEKLSKNDIIKVFNLKGNDADKEVNVCFFNAKFYESYNSKLKYYTSIPFLFEVEYKGFKESQEKFWKGKVDRIKGKTFIKYLLEKLKENIRTDIIPKFEEKKIDIDSEISDLIEKINKNHFEYKIDPKKK